jgi:hypothetical protein
MDSVLPTFPDGVSTRDGLTLPTEPKVSNQESSEDAKPSEDSTSVSTALNQDSPENVNSSDDTGKDTETTFSAVDKDPIPLNSNIDSTNTSPANSLEKSTENVTKTTEEVKHELSGFLTFKGKVQKKRKMCETEEDDEDESMNVIFDVFLRLMYPLNFDMDKTITVGVFKSMNFSPAVLINHCGKSSLVLTVDMWDKFTKYITIIEAYLYNNLTGRKTAIGFDDSNLEIDNIRLRGTQFVRFRDVSKHNKKILLTLEEFQVLSNLTPVIIRYMQQLVTYGPIIFDYLNTSVNTNPIVPLIYGPIDQSIYNRLPQEVSFYRRTVSFNIRPTKVAPTTEPQAGTSHEENV